MTSQDQVKSMVQNAVQQAINSPTFTKLFTPHKARVHLTFPTSRVTYLRVRTGKSTRTFRVVVSEVMNRAE